MQETAMGAALKRGGVNTNAALAHARAVDYLKKNGLDERRALSSFVDELRDAMGIAAEIVSYEVTRDEAAKYLARVAADMRGPKSSGVLGLVGANGVRDLHGPGSAVPPQGDGGVPRAADCLLPCGSPKKSEGDGVLIHADRQGHVAATHNKPPGIEAMRKAKELSGPSIFDTLMVRSRPIGDFIFGELSGLIATSKREAALLSLIRDHVKVPSAMTRVRDVIKVQDLQRMAQKAAEIADAN